VLGWKKLGHEKRLGACIVNYADDFVICCRGRAEEALVTIRAMMTKLKLTVNENKTRVSKLPACTRATWLVMRPIWHHKEQRVQAHILICFLAYVVWKTLGQRCQRAGLGDEPRKIFAELQQISLVDVVLPTRTGISIRKRCVSRPTDHQAILLQRLGLAVPARLEFAAL